ncbi:MAG: hypothetical protein C0597_13510 [Marinilabiliales bacterium]|nr:MAG: hypothetical protein C0597_13510 [Marinilabiliales bacterium]
MFIFFAITFLFSWILWLPGILVTYDFIESTSTIDTLNDVFKWVAGIGPSLAGIIIILKSKGKSGLKELFRNVFKFKIGLYYIPLLLILLVTLVAAHLLNIILFNASFPATGLLKEPYWIPVLFIIFYILQFSEELGWRGYALEALQRRTNPLHASIILGSIWALWHLPMFITEGFGQHDNHLPYAQFFITLVLISIIITWFQNKTKGSLVPAFTLHALVNLSGEVLPLIEKNQNTQGNYSAWIILNVILILIIIPLVIKKGKNLT